MPLISIVPSLISETSSWNNLMTKFGSARERMISGPCVPFSTAFTKQRMRSPIWYSSVGTRSRLGNSASYLPRSTVTSERSNRRTTPLIMSPTRSLNSVKMSAFSARRTCCISACLAYCAAIRPKPLGVTSTSSSSPICASALIRRASKTEIWSCLEATLSETINLAKARMSPFF